MKNPHDIMLSEGKSEDDQYTEENNVNYSEMRSHQESERKSNNTN